MRSELLRSWRNMWRRLQKKSAGDRYNAIVFGTHFTVGGQQFFIRFSPEKGGFWLAMPAIGGPYLKANESFIPGRYSRLEHQMGMLDKPYINADIFQATVDLLSVRHIMDS